MDSRVFGRYSEVVQIAVMTEHAQIGAARGPSRADRATAIVADLRFQGYVALSILIWVLAWWAPTPALDPEFSRAWLGAAVNGVLLPGLALGSYLCLSLLAALAVLVSVAALLDVQGLGSWILVLAGSLQAYLLWRLAGAPSEIRS